MHNYQFIEAFRFNPKAYDNLYHFYPLCNLLQDQIYFIKSEHSEVQFSLVFSRL